MLPLSYKALNVLAPDCIRDLRRCDISGRTLEFSNSSLLDEPRANLKTYGERVFFRGGTKALEQTITSDQII